MGSNFILQVFGLTIAGMILLWLGYYIFLGPLSPFYPGISLFFGKIKKKDPEKGMPGDPQICPVCSIKLERGELVKSVAFPSVTGGQDRLMYIRGCYSCLENDLPRRCPICGIEMDVNDYLISRMFERSNRHNHVHVLGCNHCRKAMTLK